MRHFSRKRLFSPLIILLFSFISFASAIFLFSPGGEKADMGSKGYDFAPDSITGKPGVGDTAFVSALRQADILLRENKLKECMVVLERAQKLKPSDKYVNTKIAQVRTLTAENDKKKVDYSVNLASGDVAFQKKDYLNAKAYYQLALNIIPGDSLAQGKLKKTMDQIRSQKAQNTLFDVAVASADRLFQAGELEKAKTEYENASRILPNDPYPKQKINEIIKIQVDQQLQGNQYVEAIKAGDRYYSLKNWQPALLEYQKASKLRPTEKYPKDRIAELTLLIETQRKNDEAYIKLIADADAFFTDHSYPAARKNYENASKLKPDQVYPKNRITEIDRILAQGAKTQQDYDGIVNLADSMYILKNYIRARDLYSQAVSVKPGERYPKEMLDKVKPLAALQENDEKSKLQQAEDAKKLAAEQEKILAAQKLKDKAKQDSLLVLQKAREKAMADSLLAVQKAEQARMLAEEKTKQKARADSLAKAQLAEQAARKARQDSLAKAQVAEQAARKARQDSLAKVQLAEQAARKARQDSLAKAQLAEQAIQKARQDSLAKAQLAEQAIQKARQDSLLALQKARDKARQDSLIAAQKAEQARLAALQKARQDSLVAAQKAEQARLAALQKARQDSLEAAQKAEQARLAALQKARQDSLLALENARKDSIARREKAINEEYNSLLAGAEEMFRSKSYDKAKPEYQKALALKPIEKLPSRRIASIDSIARVEAKAERDRQTALENNFKNAIASGDVFLKNKSYTQARQEYEKALGFKPGEIQAERKIAQLDSIEGAIRKQKAIDDEYASILKDADQQFAAKSFLAAKESYQKALNLKPAESYPKTRIAEADKNLAEIARLNKIETDYLVAVRKGDSLFIIKDYISAKSQYTLALGLKPSETYPREKIALSDKALDDIAKQQALDKQYGEIIAGADRLFEVKSYNDAKVSYKNALTLKPAEKYPQTKIAEIDKIFQGEANRIKALNDSYTATISSGDKFMAARNYREATSEYTKALELKPGESYPKAKLSEIEKILADIAAVKARDSAYSATIADADKFMAEKSYEKAKTEYGKALQIKPGEAYPAAKIAEADKSIADIARQKELAENKYKSAVGKADQLLSARSYEQARAAYLAVLDLKPGDSYPQEKIKEIDRLIEEAKAREEAYRNAVTQADQRFLEKKYEEARTGYEAALVIKPGDQFATNKIEEINKRLIEIQGRKKTFDDLVIKGDDSYKAKDFGKSREYYQQASKLFPEDGPVKEKLSRVGSVIDSIYRMNKSKFDKAVSEGDKFFNGFEFDKAVDAYTEAVNLLPMENYPREMIEKIRKTLAENAVADVLSNSVTIQSNDEKQFMFSPVNIASRKDNFIYIKVKNLSGKPFNILLRYGKDKTPSGGIVIRNLSTDGKTNERLISVREQDAWYRVDNNYISVSPQGGDIEVSFIQISKAR
jgi:tetratricopeptide (TPR) repeat protein